MGGGVRRCLTAGWGAVAAAVVSEGGGGGVTVPTV